MAKNKPELLAPAGDFERLEMALHYGADAVYLAGKQFGLRASAGNFDPEQLRRAVDMCHEKGVKVYQTVNVLPHEHQLASLPAFLADSAEAGVDGFIIADLGIMRLAKKYAPTVPIHISTQLGVVNSETANMLYELGAKRVVLAREMSMEDIRAFRKNITAEGILLTAGILLGLVCLCMHRTLGGWQFGARYTCDLLPFALLYIADKGPAKLTNWELCLGGLAVAFNAYGFLYMYLYG